MGSLVLELYPLKANQIEADNHLRLGFAIDNFEATLDLLRSKDDRVTEPMTSEFGFFTIVTDPDGRKIELYKK